MTGREQLCLLVFIWRSYQCCPPCRQRRLWSRGRHMLVTHLNPSLFVQYVQAQCIWRSPLITGSHLVEALPQSQPSRRHLLYRRVMVRRPLCSSTLPGHRCRRAGCCLSHSHSVRRVRSGRPLRWTWHRPNGRRCLFPVGFMLQSNVTASWTRKAWASCSGLSVFTSTCGAGNSRRSRTTSCCWGIYEPKWIVTPMFLPAMSLMTASTCMPIFSHFWITPITVSLAGALLKEFPVKWHATQLPSYCHPAWHKNKATCSHCILLKLVICQLNCRSVNNSATCLVEHYPCSQLNFIQNQNWMSLMLLRSACLKIVTKEWT